MFLKISLKILIHHTIVKQTRKTVTKFTRVKSFLTCIQLARFVFVKKTMHDVKRLEPRR